MMKTLSRTIQLSCLVVFLIFLCSCKEITIRTHIFRDGSCQRTVEVKSESKDVSGSGFPIPTDASWQIETERDKKDTTLFIYRATKKFAGFTDLISEYEYKKDTTLQVHLDIQIEKRFRWFYTFFDYQEIYRAYNPYALVPIHDYMTDDELRQYIIEEDSSKLKPKYEQWEKASLFEELYHAILDSARAMKDTELPETLVASHKHDLYSALMDSGDATETDKVLQVCENVLRTKAVKRLKPAIEFTMKQLEKKIEFVGDVNKNKYTNSAILPGLLVGNNSSTIESDVLFWNIEAKQFFFDDYVMYAHSRITNVWIVRMTLFIAFSVLIVCLWLIWRRKIKTASIINSD